MESTPPSAAAERPPKLDVAVTEDGLEAYVQALPDVPIAVGDVLHALAYYNVTFGIDTSLVAEVARANDPDRPMLVARGRAAIAGRDASIEYFFETAAANPTPAAMPAVASQEDKEAQELIANADQLDFRLGKVLPNVQPGDVLATKIPAMAGTPGNTVFGTSIPAPHGKDLSFAIGRNTKFGDDDLSIIARISGTPVVERDGKVSVLDTYVVKEVNLATGSISHIGNVRVDGDVLAGFTVEATGDIDVHGNVEGATLVAGRNLVVRGGMRGRARGEAAGDVVVRFVDPECTVKAKGKVIVQRNCIQGTIEALEKVSVGGNLIGGHVRSAMGVDAAVVGSSGAVPTTLEIDHTLSEALLAHLREELERLETGGESAFTNPQPASLEEEEFEPSPLTGASPSSSAIPASPSTTRPNSLPPRPGATPSRAPIPPPANTISRMKASIPPAPRSPSLPPRPQAASASRLPAAPPRPAPGGPPSVRPGAPRPAGGPASVRPMPGAPSVRPPPGPAAPPSMRPGPPPASVRPPASLPPPSMPGSARPSMGVLKIAKGGGPPASLRAPAHASTTGREFERQLSPAEQARKQMSDTVLYYQKMASIRRHIKFLERELGLRSKLPGRIICRQNCFVGVRIVIDQVEHKVLADGFGSMFFLRGDEVQEGKLLM